MRKIQAPALRMAATLLLGSALAMAQKNVEELWSGYDPRTVPLNSETLAESEKDGVLIRKVLYTSEIKDGFSVRVFAYYGFPTGGKSLPAILHVHGGGQSAVRAYVEYWAKKGYAAMSINWGGHPAEKDDARTNPDWGPVKARQTDADTIYRVLPDPRENSWFHWAVACRRALTFLERQPEVDPARLGVFGVSMGGRLTWLLAAIDERIRAASPVYGAVGMTDSIPGIPGSEQLKLAPDQAAAWHSLLDAIAYAPRIKIPLLFLGASDDFYGAVDWVDQAIGLIPGSRKWQSYTPHFNHHVEAEQSSALPAFMDRWLKGGPDWPSTPALELNLRTKFHVPQAMVTADRAQNVKRVNMYYSTDIFPRSRFWRSAEVSTQGKRWTADLPLTEKGDGLYVYASVLYDSGLSLSTRLASVPKERLVRDSVKTEDPPTLLIDDFSHGFTDWYVPYATPNLLLGDKTWFRSIAGPGGRAAVRCDAEQGATWGIGTRKVGDKKWRGPEGAALQFRIRSAQQNTLLVVATEDQYRRPKPEKVFIARVPLHGDAWETITLPLAAFQCRDGDDRLGSWQAVNNLWLQPQTRKLGSTELIGERWQGSPPDVALFEWVVQKSADR